MAASRKKAQTDSQPESSVELVAVEPRGPVTSDADTVTVHDVDQGSPEWHTLRCGLLTASEVRLIMTPTLKRANNDKSRAHTYELLAQRITGFVEPSYYSDDMLRGHDDETRARLLYSQRYAPVTEVGLIKRQLANGLTLGYSPDGLVGKDGQIECKSRRQKYQVQTILESDECTPEEYILQVQTGLIVTGRAWCDYVSYSGGLPMAVIRVHADYEMHHGIVDAALAFEENVAGFRKRYDALVKARDWPPTERSSDEITSSLGIL